MSVLVVTRDLILYFGVDMPDPGWASAQSDVDVVVQPYHPLVRYGGYAETFPHARRYIYANPTTVDPWIYERSDSPPPLIGYDPVWHLPRIDLDAREGFEWAVEHLRDTCRMVAEEAHGIFIDDLDRLCFDRQELALDLLTSAGVGTPQPPRWFVNRAFPLLDRIEDLDAVLLECLTPYAAARMTVSGITWLRQEVLPVVQRAVSRGVVCHALDYPDQPELQRGSPVADESIAEELTELVSSTTHARDRGLTVWHPRIKPQKL
jgi:hypothetical protein